VAVVMAENISSLRVLLIGDAFSLGGSHSLGDNCCWQGTQRPLFAPPKKGQAVQFSEAKLFARRRSILHAKEGGEEMALVRRQTSLL